MAENSDDSADLKYAATEEEKALIGVKLKAPDTTDPNETREKLLGIEDGVLGKIRDRERSFRERLGTFGKYLVPTMEGEKMTTIGDFKVKIKDIASERATGVIDKMVELQNASKKRLHLLGRKSAEKLAALTQRISVAKEARQAAKEYHELIKDEQAEREEIAKYVRAQIGAEGGWKTKIPLRRAWLLRKTEQSMTKLTGAEDHILTKAADEVEKAANAEKAQYDEQTRERFKNVRHAEAALRKHILRYNPDAVDVIEQRLRECATGKDFDLMVLINGLNLKHYPDKQQKEIKNFLKENVQILMGREWELSKAFEVLGRLELSGQSSEEVMRQIASMPLGTHLDVKVGNLAEKRMVLSAKRPEGRLVLKQIGSSKEVNNLMLIPDKGIGLRAKSKKAEKAAKDAKATHVEEVFDLKKTDFKLAA